MRERFQLTSPFVLYAGNIKPHKNVDRLIEAFSHPAPARRDRGRQAAHHRRRDLEVPEPAAARAPVPAAPARAVPRLRARRDARRALPAGVGVRVSVALRGLRPAAARGDGRRRAGRSRRTSRRCPRSSATRRCSSTRWTPARSPTRWRACSATPALRADLVRRGRERVKAFSWERSVARVARRSTRELARTPAHG